MPPREHIERVIAEWVSKAENDFQAAKYLLEAGDASVLDAVCFHSQQCVEKYLKAILVAHSMLVCKTHDIERLCKSLPEPNQMINEMTLQQMRWLSAFAADSRYPGDWDPIETQEATQALDLAHHIREAVRNVLPRPAL